MNQTFNYSNKKNPMQWIYLVFTTIATLLFLALFVMGSKDGEILFPLLIVILPFSVLTVNLANKLFFAKITIGENYIQYKSPFKTIKLEKDKIQAVEILKKPRRRAPIYYTPDQKPDMNIGNYFLIVRGYYKPDSTNFLLLNPVKDSYITAEYREEMLEALLKLTN